MPLRSTAKAVSRTVRQQVRDSDKQSKVSDAPERRHQYIVKSEYEKTMSLVSEKRSETQSTKIVNLRALFVLNTRRRIQLTAGYHPYKRFGFGKTNSSIPR